MGELGAAIMSPPKSPLEPVDVIGFRDEPGAAISMTHCQNGLFEVRVVNGRKTLAACLSDEQAARLWNWLQRRTEHA